MIVAVVAVAVGGVCIALLYGTAVSREREHLAEAVVQVADQIDPGHLDATALDLLPDLGDEGWAAVVSSGGDGLLILAQHGRSAGLLGDNNGMVPVWLGRVIAGEAGTAVDTDATGVEVLVAFAPSPNGPFAVIAAVDLWQVRAPFVRSAFYAVIIAGLLITLGIFVFQVLGEPLVIRLHAGESRFRELFDTMRSGAVIFDAIDDRGESFVVREVNRAAERIEGFQREELVGRMALEAFPAFAQAGLTDVLVRVWRTGEAERLPVRHYADERSSGWRDTYVFRLESGEVVTLYDDVSEQKKAEHHLRDSEARWRSIIALQAEAIVIVDGEDRIRFVNQAAETLFGLGSDSLIGEPFGFPIVVGDVAEIELIKPGGGVAYAEMQAIPMRWEGENQFLLFIRDISAHRRAEGDLRKLFQAIEQSPVSVVITDRDGRIEYVNPKFTEATGYTYAEVNGKNPRILKSGLTAASTYADLWTTISAGKVWTGELQNRKKSGDLFWELASIAPVRDVRGKVTHYVAVKEDITERKATEERLRSAQKMKAVGELTGGIAHDFNNLLAIILGNLQLLDEEMNADDECRELIADAIWSVERGSELTTRLLAFARRQHLNPKVTDVNVVIREMTDLLRRTLGEHIEVHETLMPELWPTMIDRGQLENALVNLVVNARDAMPAGGKVMLTTSNVVVESPPESQDSGPQPGGYVLIDVADTGCGMAPDVAERIFEPFFTTKTFGKGSGLGLSMVYGFVSQSGGHIAVESAPDAGTTMRIYLPQAQAPAREVRATPTVGQQSDHGRAVVLVVEDDERMRRAAVRGLRRGGYEVVEAATAEDALARLKELPDLDLLFTDVILADGMDGCELARVVVGERPATRVLLTSGYPSDAAGLNLAEEGYAFLHKPYRREALLDMVHDVLA